MVCPVAVFYTKVAKRTRWSWHHSVKSMKNYHVCNNHLFNIWSCCTCMCNLRSVFTFLSAKKTSSYWYHINSCKKCLISCIHVHILCFENCSSENVRQLGKNSQKRLPINCYWYMCACIYKEKSLHRHG